MIAKFIKEQRKYRLEDLKCILEAEDDELSKIIKRLKNYGVLKMVRTGKEQLEMSDLIEGNRISLEEDREENDWYIFPFVGIIIIEGRLLKCYPKYIEKTDKPIKELKQILKVLQKYHAKEQKLPMYDNGEISSSFYRLSAMISLLMDYYENGSYENEEQIIETNGSGEIFWDRTINNSYPMLQQNRPIYIELKTRKRMVNEKEFLKRLYETMLTVCSRELKELGLLEIFDLTEVELAENNLEDLGDVDYLLYRVECEKAVQFQTRKQKVLAIMESLLFYHISLKDSFNFSIYGTNHFQLVWENVCAKVFRNRLHYSLDRLQKEYGFVLAKEYEAKKNETLKSIIEKPKWTEYYGKIEMISVEAKDTFLPDIVTLRRIGEEIEFFIFDAKYYVTKIQPNQIVGQPGIEAVTKQYLYQLAYQKFLKAHHIHRIKNYFLMPAEKEGRYMEVRLEMMETFGLERIEVRSVSAEKMYKHYLNETDMDLDLLLKNYS